MVACERVGIFSSKGGSRQPKESKFKGPSSAQAAGLLLGFWIAGVTVTVGR